MMLKFYFTRINYNLWSDSVEDSVEACTARRERSPGVAQPRIMSIRMQGQQYRYRFITKLISLGRGSYWGWPLRNVLTEL